MADVKGDLTGVAQEGQASEKLLARLKTSALPTGNRMRILGHGVGYSAKRPPGAGHGL